MLEKIFDLMTVSDKEEARQTYNDYNGGDNIFLTTPDPVSENQTEQTSEKQEEETDTTPIENSKEHIDPVETQQSINNQNNSDTSTSVENSNDEPYFGSYSTSDSETTPPQVPKEVKKSHNSSNSVQMKASPKFSTNFFSAFIFLPSSKMQKKDPIDTIKDVFFQTSIDNGTQKEDSIKTIKRRVTKALKNNSERDSKEDPIESIKSLILPTSKNSKDKQVKKSQNGKYSSPLGQLIIGSMTSGGHYLDMEQLTCTFYTTNSDLFQAAILISMPPVLYKQINLYGTDNHNQMSLSAVNYAQQPYFKDYMNALSTLSLAIAYGGFRNLMGNQTDTSNDEFKCKNRRRLARALFLQGIGYEHIVWVNKACEANGIVLNAPEYLLFCQQMKENPSLGSPRDAAYETILELSFFANFHESINKKSTNTNQMAFDYVGSICHSMWGIFKSSIHQARQISYVEDNQIEIVQQTEKFKIQKSKDMIDIIDKNNLYKNPEFLNAITEQYPDVGKYFQRKLLEEEKTESPKEDTNLVANMENGITLFPTSPKNEPKNEEQSNNNKYEN